MIWLCVFLLLSPAAFGAQRRTSQKPAARKPAETQATRWPIETLSIEGNHLYTSEQILAVAGLKKGQMAGKAEFEAARDRLVATGAFETVGYKFAPAAGGTGYAASFQVVEVEPAYAWRLEALGVPDQQLKPWLAAHDPLLAPKIPGTQPVLDRVIKRIQQYRAEHNLTDKVIGKIVPGAGDELEIVFRPARSEPAVSEVKFEGNKVVPSTVLQNAIAGVAIGQPFQEDHFRQYLDSSVKPVYDARGRIRAAFTRITAEPAKDVDGLIVKVAVEEGNTYDLGDVKVAGATAIKPDVLLKTGNFKTGDLANFDDVNAGVERMKDALHKLGYMRAAATLERKIDDQKKTVDVVVHIEQGPQFLFGKLHIQGLDLNSEAGIRNLWALKEGQPFRADYPAFFLHEVQQRGMFDNLHKTRSTTDINEQTHTVDVTLYFQ